MIYENVTSIKWINKERTKADCFVLFPNIDPNPLPFTASFDDCSSHGQEIFNKISNGDFGEVELYTEPSDPPQYDLITQGVRETEPLLMEERYYLQQWEIYTLDETTIDLNTATEKERLKTEYMSKIQNRLDTFSKTRDYENIADACSYSTSNVPQYKLEGEYCVVIRDDTWLKFYEIIAEIDNGTRPLTTTYGDIEKELPALEWPV
jgi:hypothetical protein